MQKTNFRQQQHVNTHSSSPTHISPHSKTPHAQSGSHVSKNPLAKGKSCFISATKTSYPTHYSELLNNKIPKSDGSHPRFSPPNIFCDLQGWNNRNDSGNNKLHVVDGVVNCANIAQLYMHNHTIFPSSHKTS